MPRKVYSPTSLRRAAVRLLQRTPNELKKKTLKTQAILLLQANKDAYEIAYLLGKPPEWVFKLEKNYLNGGHKALDDKREWNGRKSVKGGIGSLFKLWAMLCQTLPDDGQSWTVVKIKLYLEHCSNRSVSETQAWKVKKYHAAWLKGRLVLPRTDKMVLPYRGLWEAGIPLNQIKKLIESTPDNLDTYLHEIDESLKKKL